MSPCVKSKDGTIKSSCISKCQKKKIISIYRHIGRPVRAILDKVLSGQIVFLVDHLLPWKTTDVF